MKHAYQQLDDKKIFIEPIERFRKFQFADDRHSIRITMTIGEEITFAPDASHYIVICDGKFEVKLINSTHELSKGWFGSFPGLAHMRGEGRAVVVSSVGCHSPTLIGGPIEERGRLRYVDGCTSSMLLSPPVRGEPCLNFMHLPNQVSQTMHTHPSLRAGIILSGGGQCETESGEFPFKTGTVFFIPPDLPHSFRSRDETLRIAIFHPDSDSGPTHTDHTMLNRTFVDGQCAQLLTAMHTLDGVHP
jgi:quercetin dioxygenase-like cupin family protein